MRLRPLIWMLVSLLCFVGAIIFWRLGDQWTSKKMATLGAQPAHFPGTTIAPSNAPGPMAMMPVRLLSEAGNLNSFPAAVSAKTNRISRLAYRLSNTTQPMRELKRVPSAILLENALLDTANPAKLAIPDQLRAQGDPGAYIVQARGPLDDAFRSLLKSAGANNIAYIPNNAYLVRASASVAGQLGASPQTRAVVPYEPYYKLKPSLLALAVKQEPLSQDAMLNVLLFADAHDPTFIALQNLGAQILSEQPSPFGPVVTVRPPLTGLADIAGLSGVQEVEYAQVRYLANDLSRATLGVAADSVTQTNYLGLTGNKVLVGIDDTGVDTNHPDLQGRIICDFPISGVDSNGHGTHVAGIIAGSGLKSLTVTNAQGSIMPPTNGQFRGMAPSASLYSMMFTAPDFYLQTNSAGTNVLISNNSWTYGDTEYDLPAASYDAAVRDSWPQVTGSQPVLYVFPAGNGGSINNYDSGFNDSGLGGDADTIRSPGTAKNVLTIGAIEQPRGITNKTWVASTIDGVTTYITNQPWMPSTDSGSQVANFSSRGNVGIGIEGDAGRFKPDLVAPGTFVVSTRSGNWDEAAYYNPTNYVFDFPPGPLIITSNTAYNSGILIPDNAVEFTVGVFGVTPSVDLPVSVTSPSSVTVTRNNRVTLPTDGALSPVGGIWGYSITNGTTPSVSFNIETILVLTNEFGNYLGVLQSNVNDQLCSGPPYLYRYESGTSMAAGDVSGTLALMEEFLEQRTQKYFSPTNHPSPALLKALLINGARTLGDIYSLQVSNGINYQGWGLVNLPNSLPGSLSNLTTAASAAAPLFLFDQSPANALATGESQTRIFKVAADAQTQPLRFTLVWTDPPGNPSAGIKLVNDLDLIVTNMDTGDVFFGNDINVDPDFNLAWDTNTAPNLDVVNNVENVFLRGAFGTNYSVTVVGRHVNVNAVTDQRTSTPTLYTNNVMQDYALVVSSGDGGPPDALTLTTPLPTTVYVTTPYVTFMTNSLPDNPDAPATGGLLLHQRVGANTPLWGTNTVPLTNDANAVLTLGMTNQWHFFVLTNEQNFTNAAFVTFLPPDLSIPRMGVNESDLNNATRIQADIDLYVSTSPTLTNLDPVAVAGAYRSVGRGGTELIVLSNAAPSAKSVWYVGVKSEDQMAAEFAFLGIFSLLPFGTGDQNGNLYLRGIPVPSAIPPGTPAIPKAALVLGLNVMPIQTRRVIVTNIFEDQMPGQLLGSLNHNTKTITLNNHTCATDPAGNCYTIPFEYIYEDNGEGNVLNARHSDGPGSLKDFIGEEGLGVWIFTMINTFPGSTGQVDQFTIKLEPSNLNSNGVPQTILAHTWSYDFIDVPPDATNLVVCVSDNTLPMDLYVKRGSLPDFGVFDYHLTVQPPGDCLSITPFSAPPLVPGRYYIGVYNPNDVSQTVRVTAYYIRNPFAIASSVATTGGVVPILSDAVTDSTLFFSNHMTISSMDVGMLISDPRISDLAITLISPSGTRILLMENRGGLSTNGLGTFSASTNGSGLPVLVTTNMTPFWTNDFETAATGLYSTGVVFQGWSVLTNFSTVYPELPAPWLHNNVLLPTYGTVSNTLPTTNATVFNLSFKVSHAPYLVGMVGWWPLDTDASDIFGGFNGLLSGDTLMVSTGKVNQAYYGDGVASRMMVPAAPDLDVGIKRGFSIEGWINPAAILSTTNAFAAAVLDVRTNPANGHVYYLLPSSTWTVAEANAQALGGHLATIRSQAEDNFVWNLWGATNSLWTGLYDPSYLFDGASPQHAADFIWVSGETNTFRNWRPGEPNNGAGGPLEGYAYILAGNQNVGQGVWNDSPNLNTVAGQPNLYGVAEVIPASPAMPIVEWWGVLTNWQVVTGAVAMADGFENAPHVFGIPAGSYVSGWSVDAGDVDVLANGDGGVLGPLTCDSGVQALDLNGTSQGTISTNIMLVPGASYLLSFAYARSTDSVIAGVQPQASILLQGNNLLTVTPPGTNVTWRDLVWLHTSVVFTAASPLSKLTVQSLTPGPYGVVLDTFQVTQLTNTATPQGVQFWLSGLPGTNGGLGTLWANIWDTNSTPHIVSTVVTNAITNGGWQHVALTFDTNQSTAVLYTNGQRAVTVSFPTNFVPRTSGDLYFGFHTDLPGFMASYAGGLDEFSVYERALSDCEVLAIYKASTNGKYSPIVLDCPVVLQVTLGAPINLTAIFTNGIAWTNTLGWTNGPLWEIDSTNFVSTYLGPQTNLTPLVLTALDPNVAVDDFVLSGVWTNYSNGLMHFTENTNLATVPIKFAPAPYLLSNIPPTLIFSNYLGAVTQQVYQVGGTIPGSTNDPGFGPRDWTVVSSPVTVISNILVDATHTNCVAMAMGGLQCQLPTSPGHRYQLSYTLRGPGAVSWWTGDTEPLSHRAWDVIGGNNGAYINGATNLPKGFVGNTSSPYGPHRTNALFFNGIMDPSNHIATKIELGDPADLHLTNAFTIEGWFKPIPQSNGVYVLEQIEQLFFRGDSRDCMDPYYLGLEQTGPDTFDIIFHVETGTNHDCGVILETDGTRGPVPLNNVWQHIAATFESYIPLTNNPPHTTNQLRLYLNGYLLTNNVFMEDPVLGMIDTTFTAQAPFADLDPAYSPGIAIGNCSRADNSLPYRGYIDELSVYGRALTDPEIAAIAGAGAAGKADFTVAPAQGLAKLNVSLDNTVLDTGYGDNAHWGTHSFVFTAIRTNTVLQVQSLEPGTIFDGVTLTELPAELNYLPEESLATLNGEDAYGTWTLELWDNLADGTNANPMLLDWQLNFVLVPKSPPVEVELFHGITYTNALTALGVQSFIVNVPLWATNATNVLLTSTDRVTGNPLPVGMLWSLTNSTPSLIANALQWPPALPPFSSLLSTNTNSIPYMVQGQPYYLTVTNPNPVSLNFAMGVWFDIAGLTNCQLMTNFAFPAGIPRYFQLDMPTNTLPPGTQAVQVVFLLGGVSSNFAGLQSNLTMVVSEHLPLPDLTHYDYISDRPSTNDEVVMVVTNSTPYNIPSQTNRWYVGIYNTTGTNVFFTIEGCYSTNYPTIIQLTNSLAYNVLTPTNQFAAPPGPPAFFFYEFQITNFINAVLFEMYNLSGDADLVLQRDVPPGFAPYFAGSFSVGTSPEQIVLRSSADLADLRGNWFLGVYNNEATNVSYSIRAVTQQNGMLQSAQPLVLTLSPLASPGFQLLQWNSVIGESYVVDYATSQTPPVVWHPLALPNPPFAGLVATTPLTTLEVPTPPAGTTNYYRVRQVPRLAQLKAPLYIQLWSTNQVRISWPTSYQGETLQYSLSIAPPIWINTGLPVTVETNRFVVYDLISTVEKFYRLVP